jgi:hypothetical protein
MLKAEMGSKALPAKHANKREKERTLKYEPLRAKQWAGLSRQCSVVTEVNAEIRKIIPREETRRGHRRRDVPTGFKKLRS